MTNTIDDRYPKFQTGHFIDRCNEISEAIKDIRIKKAFYEIMNFKFFDIPLATTIEVMRVYIKAAADLDVIPKHYPADYDKHIEAIIEYNNYGNLDGVSTIETENGFITYTPLGQVDTFFDPFDEPATLAAYVKAVKDFTTGAHKLVYHSSLYLLELLMYILYGNGGPRKQTLEILYGYNRKVEAANISIGLIQGVLREDHPIVYPGAEHWIPFPVSQHLFLATLHMKETTLTTIVPEDIEYRREIFSSWSGAIEIIRNHNPFVLRPDTAQCPLIIFEYIKEKTSSSAYDAYIEYFKEYTEDGTSMRRLAQIYRAACNSMTATE